MTFWPQNFTNIARMVAICWCKIAWTRLFTEAAARQVIGEATQVRGPERIPDHYVVGKNMSLIRCKTHL